MPANEKKLIATERIKPTQNTDNLDGQIVFQPLKAIWLFAHSFAGLAGIVLFPQWDAVLVLLGLCALTICLGHSIGMHRLLIHRSFKTYPMIEYAFVWLGVLVGMAGPFGMITTHDMRDWHQRQTRCPAHPAHGAGFLQDAWWQLCCSFQLTTPPDIVIEDAVQNDRMYKMIERYWMLHAVLPAAILYVFGGWAWVLWGVCLRISVSLIGHWMVGHFAHKKGQQSWRIRGLPVQGYNLPRLGWVTFGENWHGNHHAFPHSAQLGLEPGQSDPGFAVLRGLRAVGLVWDIKLPTSAPQRAGLEPVAPRL